MAVESVEPIKGMIEETVTITRKEYEFLRRESRKLTALECAGVDSWEGYDIAIHELMVNEDEDG